MRSSWACFLVAVLATVAAPLPSAGYATFTHQELIDLVWNDSIRPLLLERFPDTTPAGLELAHAYAYGGCVIQDLGYYPFGKAIFSDLAHYVRSGDFVNALLRNAKNVNDLAFAIGALSHYLGDTIGHSEAVNPSTALTFPKLQKKFGAVVTYEEKPVAHVRVEFGFDVAQIGRWRYAPRAYHEVIGFRVSRAALDRAFYETYGLTVPSVLGPQRSAILSYWYSVRHLIPLFARATIVAVRNHLRDFLATTAATEYQKKWSGEHHRPGIQAHMLNVVIRLVPKIGILKILSIKAPTSQTEDLFVASVDHTVRAFRERLADLSARPQADLVLPNRDLDTGDRVKPGAYRLTDKTYAALLKKITAEPDRAIPAALRDNILAYYADPAAPISTKRKRKKWQEVLAELSVLRAGRKVAARYDGN
jgi:Zinc dependent phospholipase C